MTFPTHEVRVLDELGQMRVACEQRSCRSNDSSDTGNLVTEIKVVVACARSDTLGRVLWVRNSPVRETSGPMAFMTGTMWLPLVTELSTDGLNTSPENNTSPSRLPSGLWGH